MAYPGNRLGESDARTSLGDPRCCAVTWIRRGGSCGFLVGSLSVSLVPSAVLREHVRAVLVEKAA